MKEPSTQRGVELTTGVKLPHDWGLLMCSLVHIDLLSVEIENYCDRETELNVAYVPNNWVSAMTDNIASAKKFKIGLHSAGVDRGRK